MLRKHLECGSILCTTNITDAIPMLGSLFFCSAKFGSSGRCFWRSSQNDHQTSSRPTASTSGSIDEKGEKKKCVRVKVLLDEGEVKMKKCGQCDKTTAKLVSCSASSGEVNNTIVVCSTSRQQQSFKHFYCRFALNVQRTTASPVLPNFTKRGRFQNTE